MFLLIPLNIYKNLVTLYWLGGIPPATGKSTVNAVRLGLFDLNPEVGWSSFLNNHSAASDGEKPNGRARGLSLQNKVKKFPNLYSNEHGASL